MNQAPNESVRNLESSKSSDIKKQTTSDVQSQSSSVKKTSIEDYITICQLGRGSYGDVVLAKQKSNDKEYAIKIINKRFMAKEKKQYQVYIEKEMLHYLKHPGVAHLQSAFQDNEKIYFVMEYLDGGDLSEFIKLNQKNLTFKDIQFYLAEVVNILEFLHSKGIAHRDMKPENILLTNTRHLKIIDFGTASIYDEGRAQKEFAGRIHDIRLRYKQHDTQREEIFGEEDDKKHRATFVGTAEYVCPELLDEDICQGPADLWALGCMCYKMFTGRTPFYENSEYLVFRNIKELKYTIPDIVPEDAASLIKQLLNRDPSMRLGAGDPGSKNDYQALKSHQFFSGIDFENIWAKEPPKFQTFKVTRDTYMDPDLIMGKPEEKKNKSTMVFYGLVQLKTGWFLYKPVDLILIEGRIYMTLVFYDPETQKSKVQFVRIFKGKIKLKDNVQIYQPKNGILVIEIDRKNAYTFREIEHPASTWLEHIDKSRSDKKKQQQKQT